MKKIRDALIYALYLCSCIFPRSKRIWAFIGWHRGHDVEVFADNTKYLFLHVANNKKDICPVWLAKDRTLAKILRLHGYRSYYEKSFLGIWYALRAGTTVIDAYLQPVNFIWTGRTRLVQLLHGRGMKKNGYGQKQLRTQDVIFSPSPFVSQMLQPAFVEQTPIRVAGYPRADIFFRDIQGSDIGIDETTRTLLVDAHYNKRFLYAPTFRRGQKILDLNKSLDLEHLSAWLVKHSYLLVINLHPKYRDQARELSYANIRFTEDSDIYPLLPQFDILINDYSSIFTDFLLLDKPIIFYPYDLQAYAEREGLSFDYNDYTPGPKAYTYQELVNALEETIASDSHSADRKRIRDLYHTYQDGESSERIMRYLESRVSGR